MESAAGTDGKPMPAAELLIDGLEKIVIQGEDRGRSRLMSKFSDSFLMRTPLLAGCGGQCQDTALQPEDRYLKQLHLNVVVKSAPGAASLGRLR